jgi:hypothetical protein
MGTIRSAHFAEIALAFLAKGENHVNSQTLIDASHGEA